MVTSQLSQLDQLENAGSAAADTGDLGPLAWVFEETRRSIETSTKSVKRFARESEAARGVDMAALDAGPLRMARQQLHQVVGALDMVGQSVASQMVRAMEGAVHQFVRQPEHCTEQAATVMERAGFALLEYLEGQLGSRPRSPIGLFPQYREIQELAGVDRIHPVDLWPQPWHWMDPATPASPQRLTCGPEVRERFDRCVLRLMRDADVNAADELAVMSLGLAGGAAERQMVAFWKLAAAFFETVARGLTPIDVYVKRAASRVLVQYTALAQGERSVPDRLALELLFFCAQAKPAGDAPVLAAIRAAWNLDSYQPVDYNQSAFGLYDPAALAQARRRVEAAKENWSALAGGDMARKRNTVDRFGLVSESLLKLHPQSKALADVLAQVAALTAQSDKPPSPELAMETATAVLFLEASFADFQPDDEHFGARTAQLARRLQAVLAGGAQQPLEPWMEELYRRVSDRQTMGSVVNELRVTLGEAEQHLDQYFRTPEDKTPLSTVPGLLAQMRGVLSVLGLDQAAQAVGRMRETVDGFIASTQDAQTLKASGRFERLGTNLGALGFLVDMLGYQPVLAKKLFAYDAETGEIKPLMGRTAREPGAVVAQETSGSDIDLELPGFGPEPLPPPDVQVGAEVEAEAKVEAEAETKVEAVGDEEQAAPPLPPTAPARAEEMTADVEWVIVPEAPPAPIAPAPMAAAAPVVDMLASVVVPAASLVSAPVPLAPAHASVAEAPQQAESEASDIGFGDDLRDIFLEEAHEVIGQGRDALQTLAEKPGDMEQQIALRRVFHTLKGSSRMVKLTEFGEAAWSMEQLLNAWLPEQKPVTPQIRALAQDALAAFDDWVDAIARHADAQWRAAPFTVSADALRKKGQVVPLSAGATAPAPDAGAPAGAVAPSISTPLGIVPLDLPDLTLPAVDQPPAAKSDEAAPLLDFGAGVTVVESDAEPEGKNPLSTFDNPEAQGSADAPALGEGVVAQEIDLGALGEDQPMLAIDLPELEGSADAPALGEGVVAQEIEPGALGDEPWMTLDLSAIPFSALPAEPTQAAAAKEAASAAPVAADEDDPSLYRQIGDLRISIPLYNVYLSEADGWSRELISDLSEWSLMLTEPAPERALMRAHSLAGSSATVGFMGLSNLARALEHALERLHGQAGGTLAQAATLTQAAEEIRGLLHQFAAGILKEPNAQVLQAVQQLEPVAASAAPVLPPTAPPAASTGAGVNRPSVGAATQGAAQHTLVDEIGAVDAVDVELFPLFEEEAEELLPRIDGALRAWIDAPEDRASRGQVMRGLHTLKGSARLAGALRLGEMAHRVESAIGQIDSESPQRSDIEPMLNHIDEMRAMFQQLRPGGAEVEESKPGPIVRTVDTLAPAATPVVPPASVAPLAVPSAAPSALHQEGAPVIAEPVGLSLAASRAHAQQVVRVRTQLLDRLVNQVGEVITSRAKLEAEVGQLRNSLTDLTGNLDRLRVQLRDVEIQAETQMQSRLAQNKDAERSFDPLEFDRFTRMQELTRIMAESVNDVATVQRNIQRAVEASEGNLAAQARQSRELQHDLLRTRMVEFESIAERLYRVVRQVSKETGKQVRLDIAGGSIEMDRGILERMVPAFEHLLRNCVVHGIEAQEVRAARGKDPVGLVSIDVSQAGNDVSVEFRDDGGGLDAVRIRERAIQKGLITPDQQLSAQDIADLIFAPGLTTADVVTELAGRGVGMDVVRTEIQALGGRVEIGVRPPGHGTAFKLVMPLTTAVTHVVMLRAGDLSIGVPSNVVETVRRVTADELKQAYHDERFDQNGESAPFYWAGALLQSSPASAEPQSRTTAVVVFRSADRRVALHVDEVLGQQEVVVKNLGPQLVRLPGLVAVTALASGAVALIYNPVALANVYGRQARAFSAQPAEAVVKQPAAPVAGQQPPVLAQAAKSDIPLVLVVDDSITVRRVTQRLLQREGYRVTLANDGLQGLERLQGERPVMVFTDIEMPRMDGFDFVRAIRADAALRDLPVVMVTSRIAEKHREHARELGVDHYLGKPYSEEELLGLVKKYAQEAAEKQAA